MSRLDQTNLDELSLADLLTLIESIGGMNERQFNIAVKGKSLRQKTKDVLFRVLVRQETRQKVIKDTGVNEQWLSRTIAEVLENYKEQLKAHGLRHYEIVAGENKAGFLEIMEIEDIEKHVPKKAKRGSSSKKKKT